MLGDFHESGEALAHPSSADAPLVTTGARLGIGIPVQERVSLFAQVDGVFVLTRRAVDIDGNSRFSLPLFAVATGIGARARF